MNEDVLPESAENFHVDLQTASGATLQADRRGTATITDDDSAPSVSINDVDGDRGEHGHVNATFTVTLSSAAPAPVTIRYSTVKARRRPPSDFTAATESDRDDRVGRVQRATSRSRSTATRCPRARDPPAETFFVDLQAVVSGPATISSDARGIGTINDDDSAPTASINDVTVTEGNTPEHCQRHLHGDALVGGRRPRCRCATRR